MTSFLLGRPVFFHISYLAPLFCFALPNIGYAQNFVAHGECGSAKIVNGESCQTAFIMFSFEGCKGFHQPEAATKILCEKNSMRARLQIDGFRYEALFQISDESTDSIEWKSNGHLIEYIKEPNKENTLAIEKRTPPAPAVPAAATTITTPPAAEPAGKLTFSGYADLRYTNYGVNDASSSATNGNAESGYGIEDGAFYVNYDKEKLSLVLDIPFRRAKSSDNTNSPTGSVANSSPNSTIEFGADKAQIFAKYKLTDWLAFDLGQFDTMFGVEVNDSKDRIFGKTGLVYDQILPVTHTGLMSELTFGSYAIKLFAADPNNKGTFAASSTGDNSTEYGAAIGYTTDPFRAQIAYMDRPILAADTKSNKDRTLLDVTAGTTLGKFSVDFEFALLTDPSKNTLTPANASDLERPGTGFLSLFSYKFTDNFLAGVRYEHLADDPGAINWSYADAYGLSVHQKLMSQLEMRFEGIYGKSHRGDSSDLETKRFSVALLAFFP